MNLYHLQSILTVNYAKRKNIDRKQTYKIHLDKAISKGQKSWNSIQWKCSKRCCLTLNTQTLLFKTVIEPQLIYASPIWATSHLKKLQVQPNRILRSNIKNCMSPPRSACEVSLGVLPLDILLQSISAKFLTKLKQNQPDIVAEVLLNALGHARSTGHLLESCLRRFEKITGNYPAQGYSTQSVTAFISELWLRKWSSPHDFAVLRMFRNTKPDCHSMSPLILGNPYLTNKKCILVFGITPLFAEFKMRLSQCASPLCM